MKKNQAKILDGKKIAENIKKELKQEVQKLPFKPGLAAVLVGDNEASKIYINLKEKACQEVGINFFKYELTEEIKLTELIKLIKKLNNNEKVHGILVQLPLPDHIDVDKVIKGIDPTKDVDGFRSTLETLAPPLKLQAARGRQAQGDKVRVVPPTHQAILRLLKETKVNLYGKQAVILANSQAFAEPLKKILNRKGIKTKIIFNFQFSIFKQKLLNYDILISALGEPNLIKARDIKKYAILIDVGFNRINNKLVGDIDFNSVKNKASFISPVPGGAGPLTVVYLLANIIKLIDITF